MRYRKNYLKQNNFINQPIAVSTFQFCFPQAKKKSQQIHVDRLGAIKCEVKSTCNTVSNRVTTKLHQSLFTFQIDFTSKSWGELFIVAIPFFTQVMLFLKVLSQDIIRAERRLQLSFKWKLNVGLRCLQNYFSVRRSLLIQYWAKIMNLNLVL